VVGILTAVIEITDSVRSDRGTRVLLGVSTVWVAIARKVGESTLGSEAIEGKRDDLPGR